MGLFLQHSNLFKRSQLLTVITPTFEDSDPDFIFMPDSTDWNSGTGDFTETIRFKLTINKNWHGLIGRFVSANTRYILFTNASQQIGFFVQNSGSILADYASTGVTLTPGQWYHAVLVRESTTMKLYLNGALQSFTENTAIGGNAIPDYAAAKDIGRTEVGGGLNYLDGSAFEYTFHNAAFDATAVSDMYNAGTPLDRAAYTLINSDITDNNLAWLTLGEDFPSSGQEFTDQAGSNNATNSGTVFNADSIEVQV